MFFFPPVQKAFGNNLVPVFNFHFIRHMDLLIANIYLVSYCYRGQTWMLFVEIKRYSTLKGRENSITRGRPMNMRNDRGSKR